VLIQFMRLAVYWLPVPFIVSPVTEAASPPTIGPMDSYDNVCDLRLGTPSVPRFATSPIARVLLQSVATGPRTPSILAEGCYPARLLEVSAAEDGQRTCGNPDAFIATRQAISPSCVTAADSYVGNNTQSPTLQVTTRVATAPTMDVAASSGSASHENVRFRAATSHLVEVTAARAVKPGNSALRVPRPFPRSPLAICPPRLPPVRSDDNTITYEFPAPPYYRGRPRSVVRVVPGAAVPATTRHLSSIREEFSSSNIAASHSVQAGTTTSRSPSTSALRPSETMNERRVSQQHNASLISTSLMEPKLPRRPSRSLFPSCMLKLGTALPQPLDVSSVSSSLAVAADTDSVLSYNAAKRGSSLTPLRALPLLPGRIFPEQAEEDMGGLCLTMRSFARSPPSSPINPSRVTATRVCADPPSMYTPAERAALPTSPRHSKPFNWRRLMSKFSVARMFSSKRVDPAIAALAELPWMSEDSPPHDERLAALQEYNPRHYRPIALTAARRFIYPLTPTVSRVQPTGVIVSPTSPPLAYRGSPTESVAIRSLKSNQSTTSIGSQDSSATLGPRRPSPPHIRNRYCTPVILKDLPPLHNLGRPRDGLRGHDRGATVTNVVPDIEVDTESATILQQERINHFRSEFHCTKSPVGPVTQGRANLHPGSLEGTASGAHRQCGHPNPRSQHGYEKPLVRLPDNRLVKVKAEKTQFQRERIPASLSERQRGKLPAYLLQSEFGGIHDNPQ